MSRITSIPNAAMPDASRATERHYSVAEVAKMWTVSPDMVRRLFQREPGVLVFGDARPKYGRRRYLTLRIPESVLERVHRRMSLTFDSRNA
jgi:hypothetical protein